MKQSVRREIDRLLDEQQGLIARWQLVEEGLSDAEIRWLVRGWRTVHNGVYVTGHAPLTDWQRWYAATLTEAGTALARWSVTAMHGLRVAAETEPVHVLRNGSGGRRRYPRAKGRLDSLDLRYSTVLAADLETVKEVECTTLARAILDLCMLLSATQRDRLFRDAIRLGLVTREELSAVATEHRGARGVARLRALLEQYSEIPIERTRSDAEIEGLVVLERAGEPQPLVNVSIAGYEADLVDPDRRVILELDGKSTHQFPERDAERDKAWEAAGFTVQRRPTDDAYDDPGQVLRGIRGLNRT